MTIVEDRLSLLENLYLKSGGHQEDSGEMCVMEAVAFIAGEPWGDSPKCASAVISAFLRSWNDSLDDEGRQKLKPYIPKLVGTKASDKIEAKRAWMCVDWYIHHHVPAWLELAGMKDHATKVRALPKLLTDKALTKAQPTLEAAQKEAFAAWSAARSAAWSAAWSAARSAAESAAWSAAESAARSAAESAAWSAAESAAWSAARSAAWSAAEDVLTPVVIPLQQSAFELLDAMLALHD